MQESFDTNSGLPDKSYAIVTGMAKSYYGLLEETDAPSRDPILNREYVLYAVVLTGREDGIIPGLFDVLDELDKITGSRILIIVPKRVWDYVGLGNSPQAMRYRLGRYLNGNVTRPPPELPDEQPENEKAGRREEALRTMTAFSLDFVEHLGIEYDALPCIVFFDKRGRPDHFVVWPLGESRTEGLVKDFRRIRKRVDRELRGRRDDVDFLDMLERMRGPSFGKVAELGVHWTPVILEILLKVFERTSLAPR